jgi:hypothetical protein
MTLMWAIIYLSVSGFSGGVLPTIELWNAWAITLMIAVVLDILL